MMVKSSALHIYQVVTKLAEWGLCAVCPGASQPMYGTISPPRYVPALRGTFSHSISSSLSRSPEHRTAVPLDIPSDLPRPVTILAAEPSQLKGLLTATQQQQQQRSPRTGEEGDWNTSRFGSGSGSCQVCSGAGGEGGFGSSMGDGGNQGRVGGREEEPDEEEGAICAAGMHGTMKLRPPLVSAVHPLTVRHGRESSPWFYCYNSVYAIAKVP